ncbi:unnamed protein product [Rotaria sp. Silwood1]|nr:unnamed protein product [Rotaria sp. Silwood1]CAF4916561.1 unnamed protein product [Rotaria sp. Silwood1]
MSQLVDDHRPIQYFLRPIQCFFANCEHNAAIYVPLSPKNIMTIKQYLLPVWLKMTELQAFINSKTIKLCPKELASLFHEIYSDIKNIIKEFSDRIKPVNKSLLKFRKGKLHEEEMNNGLIEIVKSSLREKIDFYLEQIRLLKEKVQFIKQLENQNIKYLNMQHISIKQNNDLNALLEKEIKPKTEQLIFCSSDGLLNRNLSIWNEFYNRWLGKGAKDPSLDLIYVDFSYHISFELPKLEILTVGPLNSLQRPENRSASASIDLLNARQISSREEGTSHSNLSSKSLNFGVSNQRSEVSRRRLNSPENITTSRTKQSYNKEVDRSNLKRSTDINSNRPSHALREDKEKLLSEHVGKSKIPDSSTNSKLSPQSSSRSQTTLSSISSTKLDEYSQIMDHISMSSPRSNSLSLASPRDKRNIDETKVQELPSHIKSDSLREKIHIKRQIFEVPLHRSTPSVKIRYPSRSLVDNRDADQINSKQSIDVKSNGSLHGLTEEDEKPFYKLDNEKTKRLNQSTKPKASPRSPRRPSTPSSLISLAESEQYLHTNNHNNNNMSTPHSNSTPPMTPRSQQRTDKIKSQESPSKEKLDSSREQIHSKNSTETPLTTSRPVSSQSLNEKYINVLLLGESGVGKSTFINALINYITFENFEEACTSKPIVAIPVSFMMTVGDNFEEKIIHFGRKNSNEDHNHPGQSVTQHCRSYIFAISSQTKIRLIDTPGMGDTRGLTQDDMNLEHIISFISNLSHLNAICILLKPNEAKLNIVVRSYFDRLLNFLGEAARENIVFCFTNTRSTFFSPGNTGPLLKKMLESCRIKNILYKKANTFCFDSEAFRYLVALTNQIEFDEYQKKEYQQSWTSSFKESTRLLEYLCGDQLEPYSQTKWKSIEHARLIINQMIRPILETTRNLCRNIIQLEQHRTNQLINLFPIVLPQPLTICYKCEPVRKRYSEFLILLHDLHTVLDSCKDCIHPRQDHVELDYDLQYQIVHDRDRKTLENMKFNFKQLKGAILEFGEFYANTRNISNKKDEILSTLNQMIIEEKQLSSTNDATYLNQSLYKILQDLRKQYKEAQETFELVELSDIYQRIEEISKIDDVEKQMSIVKEKKAVFMKQHEKRLL